MEAFNDVGSSNTKASNAPIKGSIIKSILKYKVSDLFGKSFFTKGIVPLKSSEYRESKCAQTAPNQVWKKMFPIMLLNMSANIFNFI